MLYRCAFGTNLGIWTAGVTVRVILHKKRTIYVLDMRLKNYIRLKVIYAKC